MKLDLRTPTPADMKEFNENSERPYFVAESGVLDGGAVELAIGGVTIAGIFYAEDAYELALSVLDMENPERPRVSDSVEWQEANLSEDELEWQAWSALTALHSLRSPQTPPTAPNEDAATGNTEEAICSPQNALQSVPEPIYLEPVGIMTHEEVAAAFDKHVTGEAA